MYRLRISSKSTGRDICHDTQLQIRVSSPEGLGEDRRLLVRAGVSRWALNPHALC